MEGQVHFGNQVVTVTDEKYRFIHRVKLTRKLTCIDEPVLCEADERFAVNLEDGVIKLISACVHDGADDGICRKRADGLCHRL